MITLEELNLQNHKITELSHVLSNLIQERSMCDNKVTVELFFRYVDGVKEHLDLEDKHLYSGLLAHKDKTINQTASRFLSGSSEIKRVFDHYLRTWCKRKQLFIRDHDKFVKDTEEMFQLVLKRIVDETEHLYPLIREVSGIKEKEAA